LDVGSRRIGFALSDPTGTLATPLSFINRTTGKSDIEAVLFTATIHQATQILVGMPLRTNGARGIEAREMESFCQYLKLHTDISVIAWDERYSTMEAEKRLREAGHRPSRHKGRTDAAAAAVILQSYLDSMRI